MKAIGTYVEIATMVGTNICIMLQSKLVFYFRTIPRKQQTNFSELNHFYKRVVSIPTLPLPRTGCYRHLCVTIL